MVLLFENLANGKYKVQSSCWCCKTLIILILDWHAQFGHEFEDENKRKLDCPPSKFKTEISKT